MNQRTVSNIGLGDIFPISHNAMSQESFSTYSRILGPDYQGNHYIEMFKKVSVDEETLKALFEFLHPVWLWHLEKLLKENPEEEGLIPKSLIPVKHSLTLAYLFLSNSKPAGLGSRSKRKIGDCYHDPKGSALRYAFRHLDLASLKLKQECLELKGVSSILGNLQKVKNQFLKVEFEVLHLKWKTKEELHSFFYLSQAVGEKRAKSLLRSLVNFLENRGLRLDPESKRWENRVTVGMRAYKNIPPEPLEMVFVNKEKDFINRIKIVKPSPEPLDLRSFEISNPSLENIIFQARLTAGQINEKVRKEKS